MKQFSAGRTSLIARLFATLLFACYANFLPVHLTSEAHLGLPVDSPGHLGHQHFASSEPDHHHHDHHHPHGAADHTLAFQNPGKSPRTFFLDSLFLPVVATVVVDRPEPLPFVPETGDRRPPDAAVPRNFQPRAPPLT